MTVVQTFSVAIINPLPPSLVQNLTYLHVLIGAARVPPLPIGEFDPSKSLNLFASRYVDL